MSGTLPANEPDCVKAESLTVELLIDARPRDLGGFEVRRLLPSPRRMVVGPFIFFDHIGPAHLPVGSGMDVRPHPHIGLATVTYLFQGEIVHRDSLGSVQPIVPGDVNWMEAGRGIVHSERSPQKRDEALHLHGIQSWVALPLAAEENLPRFEHHPANSIPVVRLPGATIDVIAGTAYDEESPVGVASPTLYAHARLAAAARLPVERVHEERAVYIVEGTVGCEGRVFQAGTMVVFRPEAEVVLETEAPARVMLVGGAKLDGPRFVSWNFVASSPDRIERAKADWRAGRFPKVPGDEVEFIPLPES
jgi:redox-sensitive bicupin YhaK (pirin superfamily)